MALSVTTEQDFEADVLRSELPVLIVFYTDQSNAFKTVEPELEAASRELEGKARILKVNADRSKRLAASLRVQTVPTYVAFAGGRPVALESGVRRKKQILDMMEPFLPRAEGAVKARELAQAMKEGQVVPVDTRDAGSFKRAHIPGATNIPIEEIPTRMAELQLLMGAPILYCRSGDKAKEASDTLAAEGVGVGFLEGGFLGWESEGLPIERD